MSTWRPSTQSLTRLAYLLSVAIQFTQSEEDQFIPAGWIRFTSTLTLSLITGDTGNNGLGKSFLLDTAWLDLTGTWADLAAYPNPSQLDLTVATITFAIEGEQSKAMKAALCLIENRYPGSAQRSALRAQI